MSQFVAGILSLIPIHGQFVWLTEPIVTYQGYYFLNLALHSDNEDLKQKFSIFAITLKGRLLSAKKIYRIFNITQNTSKIKIKN